MPGRHRFTLVFAPETVEHLLAIDRKYHGLIRRMMDQQLHSTPEQITRNRKPLDEPGPYGATWELRFGPQNRFRVFYEVAVDVFEVHVLAIGVKERERLHIGGKEYTP
jgi:mRNA-degrading endonuclease RelE of RelBE toxin-antitoxin system